MTGIFLLVCSLGIGSPDAVSTENLDLYVEGVAKSRKACGPTAAWYCLRRLGYDVRLKDVWQQAQFGPDGMSMADLLELFHSRGVAAQAMVSTPRRLETLPIPAILVIDQKHCIVYEGIEPDGQTVRYFEPSTGQMRRASRSAFYRQWSGEVIVFESPSLSPRAFAFVVLLGAAGTLGLATASLRLWSHRRPATAISDPRPSLLPELVGHPSSFDR